MKRRKMYNHDWERKLGPPPPGYLVFRQVLLERVSHLQPKSVPELFQEMLDDYGFTTMRNVHRHIKVLLQEKKIVVVSDDDSYGYVKTGRIRSSDDVTPVLYK